MLATTKVQGIASVLLLILFCNSSPFPTIEPESL